MSTPKEDARKFAESIGTEGFTPRLDIECAYFAGLMDATQKMWRKVEEELPNNGIPVIFSDGCSAFMGMYRKADDTWISDSIGAVEDITHWMHIPSIPNNED